MGICPDRLAGIHKVQNIRLTCHFPYCRDGIDESTAGWHVCHRNQFNVLI